MLSIFSEYFSIATRLQQERWYDLPLHRRDSRGRWRANPKWRDLPEEY